MTTRDVELVDPPSDGISAVRFCPTANNLLLVASWDGFLRMYDVGLNTMKETYPNRVAALDCCFSTAPQIFSSGIDGSIRRYINSCLQCL